MEMFEKAAHYCHSTLKRQLEHNAYHPMEWAINAATLSQFYINKVGQYPQPVSCSPDGAWAGASRAGSRGSVAESWVETAASGSSQTVLGCSDARGLGIL